MQFVYWSRNGKTVLKDAGQPFDFIMQLLHEPAINVSVCVCVFLHWYKNKCAWSLRSSGERLVYEHLKVYKPHSWKTHDPWTMVICTERPPHQLIPFPHWTAIFVTTVSAIVRYFVGEHVWHMSHMLTKLCDPAIGQFCCNLFRFVRWSTQPKKTAS